MQPDYSVRYTVTSPDGETLTATDADILIGNPLLWWPNGYGKQPLYTVCAELIDDDGERIDLWEKRIGLRTMTMTP